jgi:uncharacterized MAPEG superfamily protein
MDTIQVIVYLVLWAIALSFLLVAVRIKEKGPRYSFRNDGSDLSDFGLRATRALGNTLENLAPALGIMLLAVFLGKTEVTNGLAAIFLYCRIGQSVLHLISTSFYPVLLRATLYFVQLILLVIMGLKLIG